MSWRLTWLTIVHVISLGLAWWLDLRQDAFDSRMVLLWLVLFDMAWLAWDSWLGWRYLLWVRRGLSTPAPGLPLMWGEMSEAADVQHRRHLRNTLAAEDKLDVFLDAMQASPMGVVLLDEVGRMEWFNFIAAEHFGFQNPHDLGQHIIHLVRNPDFVRYWVQPLSGTGVVIVGRKHTTQRPVRLSVQFFPYGEGKRLLLSRDITAIEQADRMRRDFVANVSHEIRTPLTVLSGFIETMQSVELSSEEQAHYLALMAQQAGRMQALVQDLLALSRLEGSPPPDLSERIVVRDLLAQSCANAQALSGVLANGEHPEHQVQADVQVDDSLCVLGSRTELESAFGNLLGNAVRYTPFGGTIIASARMLPEGGVRLEVRDSGPGIAREHLPRLTERFYRIDHSRSRETGGTGLGLAIVKHVAQRHGAELQITSDLGMGSCFALEFPAQRVCHVDAAPLHDRPILAAVE
ncbi:MAG: phosphate regulon sensor histidine kinase PhoR [Brachymonas sp.]|uniref:phosphate regulon sensor histidine kinase PhoR n=1 Tax=Brachymonas sp. TaxID=1936292 RepID=UPI0035B3EE07